jgi:hypothetical protein
MAPGITHAQQCCPSDHSHRRNHNKAAPGRQPEIPLWANVDLIQLAHLATVGESTTPQLATFRREPPGTVIRLHNLIVLPVPESES